MMVGLVGIEPTTSRLSGVRSSHLSYRPLAYLFGYCSAFFKEPDKSLKTE